MIEEWKPVVDFEEWYEVSNLGRVRSWYDKDGKSRAVASRILSPKIAGHIYARHDLYLNGARRRKYIHTLVMQAFVGPRPSRKYVVAHWDGNPHNNVVSNLRWATYAQNTADTKRHESYIWGDRSYLSKITNREAEQIRLLYSTGKFYQRVIGEKFGITQSTVSYILSRKTYAHI